MPQGTVAGSYDNCVFTLIRHCQMVFQTGCVISDFHQRYMRDWFLHILSSIEHLLYWFDNVAGTQGGQVTPVIHSTGIC